MANSSFDDAVEVQVQALSCPRAGALGSSIKKRVAYNSLDNTEEVHVDVEEGEVDGDEPGALGDPQPALQLLHDADGVVLEVVQVLGVARPGVGGQLAPGRSALQLLFRLVLPAVGSQERLEKKMFSLFSVELSARH